MHEDGSDGRSEPSGGVPPLRVYQLISFNIVKEISDRIVCVYCTQSSHWRSDMSKLNEVSTGFMPSM